MIREYTEKIIETVSDKLTVVTEISISIIGKIQNHKTWADEQSEVSSFKDQTQV